MKKILILAAICIGLTLIVELVIIPAVGVANLFMFCVFIAAVCGFGVLVIGGSKRQRSY